ncbi:MAG: hypothetical protein IKC81_05705 [Paludibacteraceae bacterium]|nr:hypothetical protein [Paludibacteraceae bacterium]
MTKEEYKERSEDVLLSAGFRFSHRGCVCNGSPYIYIKQPRIEVNTWPARGLWKLFVRGSTHATGTSISDLHNQLNNLQQ